MSFESVSWLLRKLLAGGPARTERVRTSCEGKDSFEAGGALYMSERARDEAHDCLGVWSTARKERRGRQYLSPGLGRDSGATICGLSQRFSERLKHMHESGKAPGLSLSALHMIGCR
jgi:hypothetical protein